MEDLVDILIEKNYTISAAESCTGGLFAASIVSVANASKVLKESFVTYTEEAKIKYANVKRETIDKFGVVSVEVASEMALGVSKTANSNVGVGVTGYAGPTGDNVGKVCIAVAVNGKVQAVECNFDGSRNEIRAKAVASLKILALNMLK